MRKAVLLFFAAFLAVNLAQAQTTVVVKADDLGLTSWFFYDDEKDGLFDKGIDNSIGAFVAGPVGAPAGSGSAKMSVTGTQRRNLATFQYRGQRLNGITALSFSTFNPSAGNGGSATRSAYLHFDVQFSNNFAFTPNGRLLFVPAANGSVVQDTWQTWDAIAGGSARWSWSKYDSNGGKWPDGNKNRYRTWSELMAAFPKAIVDNSLLGTGFLGLRVGEPYESGFTGYVDAFVFGTAGGTTTFDFEPDAMPVDCTDPSTAPSYAGGYVTNAAGTKAYIKVDVPAGGTFFEFYNTTNLVVEGVNSAPEAGTGLTALASTDGMTYGFNTVPSPTTVYFPIRTATSSNSIRFFLKVTDTCGRTVDVDPEFSLATAGEMTQGFSLSAYPNPFAGQTTLAFSLEEAGAARLSLYDVLGREVALVAAGDFGAGQQTVRFDAEGLSSGLYIVRFEAAGRVLTQTLTIAR